MGDAAEGALRSDPARSPAPGQSASHVSRPAAAHHSCLRPVASSVRCSTPFRYALAPPPAVGYRMAMARVEIELPESFPFTARIPVRVTDLNYGGHVGNDAILGIVHEARVQFFAARGWTELDVAGAGILLADAAIVYKAEGFLGMTLDVGVAVADLRSRSCDLLYRLTDVASGKEIARAKTGIVFFDYRARKMVSVPAAFRDAFAGP
jgi:acyl-CoA thioester hydrolase